MPFYRSLSEDDIVEFEIGSDINGREQVTNVTPVLIRKMIENALKEENLSIKYVKDTYGTRVYIVVVQNDVIQSCEQGMSFLELAAYAGFDTGGLT